MRVSILFTDPATRRATLRQAAAGDRARPFEYSRRRRRLVYRADAAKVPMAPRLNILPRARMRAYGHVQIAYCISVNAVIASLGLPHETAAQAAASHIHAGISRDRPGRTSMRGSADRRVPAGHRRERADRRADADNKLRSVC